MRPSNTLCQGFISAPDMHVINGRVLFIRVLHNLLCIYGHIAILYTTVVKPYHIYFIDLCMPLLRNTHVILHVSHRPQ